MAFMVLGRSVMLGGVLMISYMRAVYTQLE
jgi:hypothetical protein